MAKIALATLLTDFGTRDPYVAAMRGAILRICPVARVVDISHDIPPHDVFAGAFIWSQAAPYFPAGTVHVGVVDPGVGTERRILVALLGGQVFLMPDNGLVTFIALALPMEAMVVVRSPTYVAQAEISTTFHGRDVFAPLAGQIMMGLDIHELGPQPETYKTLDVPEPKEDSGWLIGQVIYVDRFGNLISNISRKMVMARWPDPASLGVSCAGQTIDSLYSTYGQAGPGRPFALFNSMDLLEIAVNQGKACDVLHAGVASEVRVAPRQLPASVLDYDTAGQ